MDTVVVVKVISTVRSKRLRELSFPLSLPGPSFDLPAASFRGLNGRRFDFDQEKRILQQQALISDLENRFQRPYAPDYEKSSRHNHE